MGLNWVCHWVVRHRHHWVLIWIELLWWYITVTLLVAVVVEVIIRVVGITAIWVVWVMSDHVAVVHPVAVGFVMRITVISAVVVFLVVRVIWIELALQIIVFRLMGVLLMRVLGRIHLLWLWIRRKRLLLWWCKRWLLLML